VARNRCWIPGNRWQKLRPQARHWYFRVSSSSTHRR